MIIIYKYLSKLQLIEHLKVDLFDKISRKIDGTDPCNRIEGSTTYVVDLIVTQIQSSEKTHAAKSIGIQLSNFIVAQIQNFQDGISGEGSSKTKALLDILCREDCDYCSYQACQPLQVGDSIVRHVAPSHLDEISQMRSVQFVNQIMREIQKFGISQTFELIPL